MPEWYSPNYLKLCNARYNYRYSRSKFLNKASVENHKAMVAARNKLHAIEKVSTVAELKEVEF